VLGVGGEKYCERDTREAGRVWAEEGGVGIGGRAGGGEGGDWVGEVKGGGWMKRGRKARSDPRERRERGFTSGAVSGPLDVHR
jgi:hypothetical protein